MARGGPREGAGRRPGGAQKKEQTHHWGSAAPGTVGTASQPPRGKVGRPPKTEQNASVSEVVMATVDAELEQIQKLRYSDNLARQMGLEGLACIRAHARRGNVRCGIWLAEKMLGQPERPYAERLEAMSEAEVDDEITSLLTKLGLPAPVQELLLLKLAQAGAAEAQADESTGTLAPVYTEDPLGPEHGAEWDAEDEDGGDGHHGGPGGDDGLAHLLAYPGDEDPDDAPDGWSEADLAGEDGSEWGEE